MKYVLLAMGLVFLVGYLLSRRKPARRRTYAPPRPHGPYPGDFRGTVALEYSPNPNGKADPGEVVWTWVAFQEDPSKGKDRPVLIIGRDGTWLLGLMLTSKDHNNQSRHNANWLDIGTGAWDRHRRPSEVRLDRIIRIDPRAVRREGATVPRSTFDAVARSLSSLHHW